jgi:hypothetical protein
LASSAKKTRRAQRVAVKAAASVAAGASWMALVAATTLGIGQFARVRAEISTGHRLRSGDDGEGALRLIVQSYAPESVGADRLPAAFARPLGSVQRAVTADELRHGVFVDVVQLDAEAQGHPPIVVAWVESGAPDLEFDALQARPAANAFYGVADRGADDGSARVVLQPRTS